MAGIYSTLDGTVIDQKTAKGGSEPYLVGQGLFQECLRQVYPLLDKDAPCEDKPCLLHGQHAPAIDFDVNHFVGVSEYWHTTHEVFELSHKDKSYNFNSYQQRVDEFCSQDWAAIENGVEAQKWGKKVDSKTAMEVCFKASWLINVLHEGIGIPRVGLEKTPTSHNSTKEVLEHAKEKGFLDPFQAVDKIDDTEVSWTLGKMVLYASGQVKPEDGDLPVGFGSNVAVGTSADFQYAGSNWSPAIGGDDDNDDDWGDAADDLLEKAHTKSASGMLIFILVLFFVGYLLRKRERRLRVYGKLNALLRGHRHPGSPRKGGRSFFSPGKLFGRSSGHYERVLEEGMGADEFELHDVDSDDNDHSDSSEGSRAARSSGLATPKLNVGFSEGTYFDTMPGNNGFAPGTNLGGLGIPNAMDRSGLMVRTESRERLAPPGGMSGGRRSRNGSPTRVKSPLMSPLEED